MGVKLDNVETLLAFPLQKRLKRHPERVLRHNHILWRNLTLRRKQTMERRSVGDSGDRRNAVVSLQLAESGPLVGAVERDFGTDIGMQQQNVVLWIVFERRNGDTHQPESAHGAEFRDGNGGQREESVLGINFVVDDKFRLAVFELVRLGRMQLSLTETARKGLSYGEGKSWRRALRHSYNLVEHR